MLRLAGFLTGSAAAIGLILVVLGMPEFPPADETPVEFVASLPVPQPEPEPELESAPQPLQVPEPELPPEPDPAELRWHSFWSPFGSRIAADGFVGRLESVTGFDYRVVKVENGVFEVAFAYSDDAEREAMLNVIASATGLELPDS